MNQDIKQNINKLTLKISPDSLNKDFTKKSILENINQIRSIYIMSMIIYIAFAPSDYKFLGESAYLVVRIRLLVIIPILIIGLISTYLKIYNKYSRFISTITVLSIGYGMISMAAIGAHNEYFALTYGSMFLILFVLYSFFRLHFLHTFIVGLALTTGYIVMEKIIIQPSEGIIFIHLSLLISINFIGILIAYSTEYQSKREYLLKKLLSESLIKDALTNLHNRRYFEQVLVDDISNFIQKTELMEDKRNNENNTESSKYGILMIDIDKFKNINDTFGHHSGDLILIQLAKLLQDNIRTSDDALRIGGEEFLLVLKQTSEEYITEFIRKIGSTISNYNFIIENDIPINCTISIGLVVIPCTKAANINKLVQYADKALYHSKNMGRNRGYRFHARNDEVYFEEILWNK